MGRLIDADALIPLIKMGECNMYDEYCQGRNGGIEFAINRVNQMPTIEERKGKWIQDPKSKRYRCDQCLSAALKTDDGQENLSDFCPVCGAKMEGEEHDKG